MLTISLFAAIPRLFPPHGFFRSRTPSSGAAAALLWLGLLAPLAQAAPPSPPGLPWDAPGKTASPAASQAPDPESQRTELQRKLEDARSLRDRANAAPSGGPETVPDLDDQAQYRRFIDTLVYLYQLQLDTLQDIQEATKALATAKSRGQAWAGFEQAPPYSVLMLDELREAAETAKGKLAAHESALAQVQRESERIEKEAQRDKAAARLAEEALDRARTPEEKARARAELDLAQVRDRVSDNRLAWVTLDTRLTKVQLETMRAETTLLDRQIQTAKPHAVFTEQDLAKVRNKLELDRQKLDQERQAALAEHDRWIRERDRAQRALEKETGAGTKPAEDTPESAESDPLQARLRAANAWLQTLRFRTYALQTSLALLGHLPKLWENRHVLLNSTEPETRQKALAEIKLVLERLHPLESYLYGELDLVRADELKQAAIIDKLAGASPAVLEFEQSILNAYRAKREDLDRLGLFFRRTGQVLQRWTRDYEDGAKDRKLDEKLLEGLAEASGLGRKIWRFELFTVDDTVEIDGKPVAVTRGVTFGKSIGAILLLLIGYWVAAVFSRRVVQRLLERRFKIDTPQANVFRRWVLSLLTLILLVGVLNFVRIPLTVFAFLGGALAIGVGFGTQTLLKNLISGVMILLEHKIKVGDIVEVNGVVGTVTEIDIRSSTLRGFDGVETMVPNATFLETKVTNWTYTTRRVRRTLKVGVAYGSQVRRVAEVLGECASRHGLVLDDPAPTVWFEDFGESALLFGVYYWLEIRPNVNSNQVASDLRFMIEKRFGEEGIVLAFPQRDIHLAAVQPLQVEVVGPASRGVQEGHGHRELGNNRSRKRR